jgi:hypothetical protein
MKLREAACEKGLWRLRHNTERADVSL